MDTLLFSQDLPLMPVHKNIIRTSWARSWVFCLGQAEIYPQILSKGRSLLRKGEVTQIRVYPGWVEAVVSSQFEAQLKFKHQDELCVDVNNDLDLKSMAELHGSTGELEFLRAVQKYYPDFSRIKSICTCIEDMSICTHGAALIYGLIFVFDSNPRLMLEFLGCDAASDPSRLLDTVDDQSLSDVEVQAIFSLG
jgi:uncharacterized Zn finger protein